ncbi:MAG: murein L,D-transpeptidase catalytic domain family protein [Bacteroidaceae bacterium]|nr:murein L,D-transpeptidase catalytic domain family protein [Bacteroidaceae bacterium]
MMKNRIIVGLAVLLVFLCVGGFFVLWAWKYYQLPLLTDNSKYESLAERAESAEKVARFMGLNEKYCILVDFSMPSGTPRMFVWSFEEKRVMASTYVMHGPGKGSTDEKPVFSNKPGSNCSTLGRFAVTHEHGNRNKSGYFVRGLDVDNQSARARGLMIHRSKWVDVNCWRNYIPLNKKSCKGCFTTSSKGMDYIGKIVDEEKKQILLWSFCSE